MTFSNSAFESVFKYTYFQVPALRTFWFLEKTRLRENRVSGTLLNIQLTQNSPTNLCISQKPCKWKPCNTGTRCSTFKPVIRRKLEEFVVHKSYWGTEGLKSSSVLFTIEGPQPKTENNPLSGYYIILPRTSLTVHTEETESENQILKGLLT